MDLKKALNLNSYEWWRNHRRFITLGIFLALLGGYVRGPAARDLLIKETCSKILVNKQEMNIKKAQRILRLKKRESIAYYCAQYLKG